MYTTSEGQNLRLKIQLTTEEYLSRRNNSAEFPEMSCVWGNVVVSMHPLWRKYVQQGIISALTDQSALHYCTAYQHHSHLQPAKLLITD